MPLPEAAVLPVMVLASTEDEVTPFGAETVGM